MTLADVLAALFGLVILSAGYAATALSLGLLSPGRVERSAGLMRKRPVGTLLAGLGALVGFLVVAAVLGRIPNPLSKLLALLVILTGLTLAASGASGLASLLGQRYRSAVGGEARIGDIPRGALLAGAAALLPIVGWLVILPVGFLLSLGAGWLVLLPHGDASPLPSNAAV